MGYSLLSSGSRDQATEAAGRGGRWRLALGAKPESTVRVWDPEKSHRLT